MKKHLPLVVFFMRLQFDSNHLRFTIGCVNGLRSHLPTVCTCTSKGIDLQFNLILPWGKPYRSKLGVNLFTV